MSSGSRVPSIAVVAVHGIGEQTAGASARALADLLLRLRYRSGAARYTSFSARELRIPARPAVVEPATAPHAMHGASAPSPSGFAPEHEFMRGQLEHYESSGAPYETVRVEGDRLSEPQPGRCGEPTARIHVYEMYWADLSRLGAGPLRIFGEMYQLFFNLANLGRITVDHARSAYGDPPAWRSFGVLHSLAVRLLTILVPVAWLTMLATVLGLLIVEANTRALPMIVAIGGAVTAAAAAWSIVYRVRMLARRALSWLLIPLSGTAAGVVLWRLASADAHPEHVQAMVLATWALLAGVALHWVYRRYETVRPGAFVTGMIAYAIALAATLGIVGYALLTGDERALLRYTANLFEVETVVTVGIWYLLYATGLASAVAGLVAWKQLRPQVSAAEYTRAARVWWTAQTTLAIATWSVLVVTFVLWAAVYKVFSPLLAQAPLPPPQPLFAFWKADTHVLQFERVIEVTAGAGFPLALGVAALLGIILFVALLPAGIQELRAPESTDRFRERAAARSADGSAADAADELWRRLDHDDLLAERLGRWLSRGYGILIFATAALFVAIFVLQPLATIAFWVGGPELPLVGGYLQELQARASGIILWLGGALTAAAVGLLAFRARFRRLALGFRPMLDAALDVDNYMREHPRSSTPRARIAERYASLLRYLANWRDGEGQPYASVVLVAHSQGTVITADLLGFLQRERDPELSIVQDFAVTAHMGQVPGSGRARLFLFTMGSPLRQLYNWCFPHLFGWVHFAEAAWGSPQPSPFTAGDRESRPDRERETKGAEAAGRPAGAPVPQDETWRRPSGRTPASGAITRHEDGHVVVSPAIASTASPEPTVLGVSRWVNAYRSGDYVGRALWRVDMPDCGTLYRAASVDARSMLGTAPPPVVFASEDDERTRRELCIGRGAHTHYWNDTAASVAIELDLLIQAATPGGEAPQAGGVSLPQGAGLPLVHPAPGQPK